MAKDPYWNSVVLAMHMDDAGLTDLKGHAVTLNGNAARSSAQSKFGGYAAYFDGSGDYLTAPTGADFAFGTGDFTVECWINPVSVAGLTVIYDSRTGSVGSVGGISIAVSSGTLRCDTNEANVLTGGVVTTGAWQHVALSRASGVFKLWLGGSQVATSGAAYTLSDGYMFVGTDKTGAAYFNGYIDDLRITKGVARYTSGFTPPTGAFADRGPELSGTVKDKDGNFAARMVRAYRRSDGMLAGTAVSSGVDGTFSVNAYDGSAHYVVCLDDGTPDENALILDNITPV